MIIHTEFINVAEPSVLVCPVTLAKSPGLGGYRMASYFLTVLEVRILCSGHQHTGSGGGLSPRLPGGLLLPASWCDLPSVQMHRELFGVSSSLLRASVLSRLSLRTSLNLSSSLETLLPVSQMQSQQVLGFQCSVLFCSLRRDTRGP